MLIQLKHRYSGEVIFEHVQENNSTKITVELAIKDKVDLRGSNLRGSDLSWSNLRGSDLRESDLRGSNLLYVTGEMNFVFSMQLDTWLISFTKDILNIGCQSFPIEDWFQFSDEEISKMDVAALEWWKEWKEPLRLIIETRLGEKI